MVVLEGALLLHDRDPFGGGADRLDTLGVAPLRAEVLPVLKLRLGCYLLGLLFLSLVNVGTLSLRLSNYKIFARQGTATQRALVAQLDGLDGSADEASGVRSALELFSLFVLVEFLNHAGLLVLSLSLVIQSGQFARAGADLGRLEHHLGAVRGERGASRRRLV